MSRSGLATRLSSFGRRPWAQGLKTAFDLAVGGLSLLFVTPVMVLVGMAIWVMDGRPIFFVHERVGKGARTFRVLKFRTMVVGHPAEIDAPVTAGHPNVTPLGRLLRHTKLDELPQFLNVVKGEMSLVGPRPTVRMQTDQYDEYTMRRLRVRPGLTGLAQVNGLSLLSWSDRISYDVHYVDHVTFLLDMRILLKTLPVLFSHSERFLRPFEDSPYRRGGIGAPRPDQDLQMGHERGEG